MILKKHIGTQPEYSFYEINILYRSADALGIIINLYRHTTLVYLDSIAKMNVYICTHSSDLKRTVLYIYIIAHKIQYLSFVSTRTSLCRVVQLIISICICI